MSFIDFLTEAAAEAYEPITTEQLGILRQEVDRSALRIELNKKYIEKADLNIALFNNDFYLSGVRLADDDNVIIKGSVIVEVTEDDGYLYYKLATFTYNISTNELVKVIENDRLREENWKTIQGEILKTSKKI